MEKNISLIKRMPIARNSVSVLAGLSISLLTFSSVDALNIGQARTQSYLGQPLSIFIPVSDSGRVVDLNQLIVAKPSSVQLKDLSVSQTVSDLSYQVVNNGAEKGILITTESAFNEPYVDLGVKVDYQGASQLSKLTVLIDLEPLTTEASSNQSVAVGTPLASNATSINKAPIEPNAQQKNSQTNFTGGVQSITYNGEIMGPYDWAQKALIPERFGPVLEGQSLWRVARRINKAMDVSIDQMMWALYRANPQAFSGKDVSTLQSGSILSIPTESFVREVTELGAVRLLNLEKTAQIAEKPTPLINSSVVEIANKDISNGEVNTPVQALPEVVDDSQVVNDTNKVNTTASSNDIQLGSTVESINEQSALEPINASSNDAVKEGQSDSVVSLSKLDIIDDLKSEINYLNQQVEDQGKRIQVLEERLAIAESNGSAQLAVNANSANDVSNNKFSLNSEAVTPVENAPVESIPVESTISNPINVATPIADTSGNLGGPSVKVWSLAALALFLLGFGYFARHKIMPMVLRIFGDRYEYDEEESFLDSVSKKRKPLRPLVHAETSPEESNQNVTSQKNDDHDDFEDYSFLIDDEMDVEELSFPDRIKQLIDSGDFDEAKKTVNFASEANVDEHDINVYLLKIFAAESDRENFDKLFDKIHRNIDQYDAESQLMVAEIQSEMAIGKVINFNSSKKAG